MDWNKKIDEEADKIMQVVKSLQEYMVLRSTKSLSVGTTLDKALYVESKTTHMGAIENDFKRAINEARKQIRVSDKKIQDRIEMDLSTLYKTAINDYKGTVARVNLDSRDLFTVIKNATQEKLRTGYVVYENGRKVPFTSYMNMAVRTEMQNNALFNLEESAKAAGVEIYLSSSHADCADDHVDFQGYYYLADGVVFKEEWSKFKFHPQYKYLSQVKEKGFLTRPNCRHFVVPVSDEQLKNPNELRKQLQMPSERANKQDYIDLQEQRKNERNIRKYRARVENDKVLLQNAPQDQIGSIKAKLAKDRQLAREWSAKQKAFTEQKGLKRERIRERPGVIVNDIGVKLVVGT